MAVALLAVAGVNLAGSPAAETESISTADNPPWPAPVDPASGERAAGLTVLPAEGVVQHLHVHLDILVDGSAVSVPANIGIDVRRQLYAERHTHADSGVLHVEFSDPKGNLHPRSAVHRMGCAVGVRALGRAGRGQRTSASRLRLGLGLGLVYVDGRPISGDPAATRLVDQQEIVLAFGSRPPASVSSTFDFKHHPL